MIFNRKSIIDIAARRKTQTRRPIPDGEDPASPPWAPGSLIAMQPGRGQKHFGHLEVVAVRHERVRDISLADAVREGYENHEAFLNAWTHDIYPSLSDPKHDINRRCWVITFRLAPVQACCAEAPDFVLEAYQTPVPRAPEPRGPATREMLGGDDE